MFDFIFAEPECNDCCYAYAAYNEVNPYFPFITDPSKNWAVEWDLLTFAGPSQHYAGLEVCALDDPAFWGYPDFQVFPEFHHLPCCKDFSGCTKFPGYSDFPSLSGPPKSLPYPTGGFPDEGELHCTR